MSKKREIYHGDTKARRPLLLYQDVCSTISPTNSAVSQLKMQHSCIAANQNTSWESNETTITFSLSIHTRPPDSPHAGLLITIWSADTSLNPAEFACSPHMWTQRGDMCARRGGERQGRSKSRETFLNRRVFVSPVEKRNKWLKVAGNEPHVGSVRATEQRTVSLR